MRGGSRRATRAVRTPFASSPRESAIRSGRSSPTVRAMIVGPMRKVGATGIGGVTNIGELVVGTPLQGLGEPTRELSESLVVSSRQCEQARAMDRCLFSGHARRRLLEDNVGVGATQSERAHSADTAPPDRLPRDFLRRNLQWKVGPSDMGAWRLEMQMRRNFTVLQSEDRP